VGWIDTELALTALAAMLSPTTLTFSVLVLVLGDRPLRTGLFFYLGALGATLGIGIIAAFVLGNAAASHEPSTPKTWVAVLDVALALALLTLVVVVLRRPLNRQRTEGMIGQMQKVASSPVVAVLGAGAALANPGAFIPIALKDISELNPSASEYIVDWVFFSLVSLLPLATAIVLLMVAPGWTRRMLGSVRVWLERNVRTVAAAIVVLLALSLLRNGIAGLTA
jgi:glucan phosphoethanolaminetransferase (alkaline phosphatase superfamily)